MTSPDRIPAILDFLYQIKKTDRDIPKSHVRRQKDTAGRLGALWRRWASFSWCNLSQATQHIASVTGELTQRAERTLTKSI
jgi:hypothetical protein